MSAGKGSSGKELGKGTVRERSSGKAGDCLGKALGKGAVRERSSGKSLFGKGPRSSSSRGGA